MTYVQGVPSYIPLSLSLRLFRHLSPCLSLSTVYVVLYTIIRHTVYAVENLKLCLFALFAKVSSDLL